MDKCASCGKVIKPGHTTNKMGDDVLCGPCYRQMRADSCHGENDPAPDGVMSLVLRENKRYRVFKCIIVSIKIYASILAIVGVFYGVLTMFPLQRWSIIMGTAAIFMTVFGTILCWGCAELLDCVRDIAINSWSR